MIFRLKIKNSDDTCLQEHLLKAGDTDEEAAFLLATTAKHYAGIDFLVRDVIDVPNQALVEKGRAGLVINPRFIAQVLKKARIDDLSIFLAHSHPFTNDHVRFSAIDDYGESRLFPRLMQQVPGRPHGTCVFGRASRDLRVWLPDAEAPVPMDEVIILGRSLERVEPTSGINHRGGLLLPEITARQILALGEEANQKLSATSIGIIGAGGVGSVVFEALLRMGIARVVVVDGDRLGTSNGSRELGATINDVGKYKVQLLAEHAERIGFGNNVEPIPAWVQTEEAIATLLSCDVIVLATDTMKSRLFAARLGAQFQIPIISTGVDVNPRDDDAGLSIGGHVAVQFPDEPCVDCLGLVDHRRLEVEEMVPEIRRANPYVRGKDPDEPVPSVIAFNLALGGLVASEVVRWATGKMTLTGPVTYLMYNGYTGETRRICAKRIRNCGVCDQVRAWGDRYSLPLEREGT